MVGWCRTKSRRRRSPPGVDASGRRVLEAGSREAADAGFARDVESAAAGALALEAIAPRPDNPTRPVSGETSTRCSAAASHEVPWRRRRFLEARSARGRGFGDAQRRRRPRHRRRRRAAARRRRRWRREWEQQGSSRRCRRRVVRAATDDARAPDAVAAFRAEPRTRGAWRRGRRRTSPPPLPPPRGCLLLCPAPAAGRRRHAPRRPRAADLEIAARGYFREGSRRARGRRQISPVASRIRCVPTVWRRWQHGRGGRALEELADDLLMDTRGGARMENSETAASAITRRKDDPGSCAMCRRPELAEPLQPAQGEDGQDRGDRAAAEKDAPTRRMTRQPTTPETSKDARASRIPVDDALGGDGGEDYGAR